MNIQLLIIKKKYLENPYTNGFFSGDGTYTNITNNKKKLCAFKCLENQQYCKRHIFNKIIEKCELRDDNMCNAYSYEKKPHITLYSDKIKSIRTFNIYSKGECYNNKLSVTLVPTLEEKYFVPINYSIESKMAWFSGYCDADGSISRNGTNQSLQVSSINKDFLINIKLMLQTCGLNSIVRLNMCERRSELPKNDGSGEYREYDCKNIWRLLIASNQLQHLLALGFSPKRLKIYKCEYQRSANKFISVQKIVDNKRVDKTYCFNERHAGIFNGLITSQCTEILEYSDDNETAVCNLASISLPAFVKDDLTFDYDKLIYVTGVLVKNLNNIIDINFYPNQKTKRSNFRHRPIGIGVQGLADTFIKMNLPFTSDGAKEINKNIFETIYYGAVKMSMEISKKRQQDMSFLKENYNLNNWSFIDEDDDMCKKYKIYNNSEASIGNAVILDNKIEELLNKYKPIFAEITNLDNEYTGAYSSFLGSPMSKGIFQFDMWNVKPTMGYDWESLRHDVINYGIRNSLLVAPMPTASTAQILGNNEVLNL